MDKAEREHLKHNDTADALFAASTYLGRHGRTLGLSAVALLLVVGILFGYRAFSARTEERAQAQLAAAVDVMGAPVAPAPASGTLAVPPPAGTFATEAARNDAALRQLMAAADAYPKSDAGVQARYYAASLLADANRPGDAAAAYEQVRQHAGTSTLLGRMATLGKASMQVRQKDFDAAIKSLQDLAARRDGPLPLDAVLMQLADAYQQAGRAAEAAQTLQRVVNEFPQGPYAADARQRVEALAVAPKVS